MGGGQKTTPPPINYTTTVKLLIWALTASLSVKIAFSWAKNRFFDLTDQCRQLWMCIEKLQNSIFGGEILGLRDSNFLGFAKFRLEISKILSELKSCTKNSFGSCALDSIPLMSWAKVEVHFSPLPVQDWQPYVLACFVWTVLFLFCLYSAFGEMMGQLEEVKEKQLSLIHIWRCRRIERCRSRWSP